MTAARDIRAVYLEGRRARCGGLVVHVLARPGEGARLALAVPASVGGAVVRNRIRRRVRAAFVECRPSGLDVVVKPAGAAAVLPFQELVDSLKEALTRATGR